MLLYKIGLSGVLLQYAIKKYKSHRDINRTILTGVADAFKIDEVREAFDKAQIQKAKDKNREDVALSDFYLGLNSDFHNSNTV